MVASDSMMYFGVSMAHLPSNFSLHGARIDPKLVVESLSAEYPHSGTSVLIRLIEHSGKHKSERLQCPALKEADGRSGDTRPVHSARSSCIRSRAHVCTSVIAPVMQRAQNISEVESPIRERTNEGPYAAAIIQLSPGSIS